MVALNERIYYGSQSYLKVALVAPFVFDFSVQQIFGTLLHGHGLYITPGVYRLDGERLWQFFKTYRIDKTDSTPSHIHMLNETMEKEHLTALSSYPKHFIIGGEVLSPMLVKHFLHWFKDNDSPKITNIYGPTECTVESTSFDVNLENPNCFNNIPIGSPYPNQTIYILDTADHLQPIGIPGQLCIAGDGVGRGYLNNPELTAEKFDHDLWDYQDGYHKSYRSHKSYIIYKTGDLARWLPDGNIEFIGRMDHQVKIRGFRIELGEIENRLLTHKDISEAVVIPRTDGNKDKYLCAYIVLKNPAPFLSSHSSPSLDLTGLRNYLSETLPDYMIPSFFVTLEKMPLSPNDKVDRKALPKPGIPLREKFLAPRNKIEKKLAGIWSEVLGIKKEIIGIDANFFELGGHSLKATRLAAKIHKKLGVNVPVSEIFKTPFLRGQAEYIGSMETGIYEEIESVEEREYYPQSSAQKRFFLLDQLENIGTGYHMPAMVGIRGKPDITRIEQSFKTIIQRHESLRTSFHLINDEPVQKIHSQVEFEIRYYDLKSTQVEVKVKVKEEFVHPFDLAHAPLLRLELAEIGKEKFLLLADMHHIISDGLSMRILIEEFSRLYNGEELPSEKIQYKDFSIWQNRLLTSEGIKAQEKFWLNHLAGEIPLLALPTDYTRPKIQSFAGKTETFVLAETTVKKVKSLAAAKQATLYMVLLTMFYILLSKLTGNETIIIGTPIAGRRHADLEHTIGVFINTLALKNQPIGEKTIHTFLQEVKENTWQAFENQDYPYEHLVEQMGKNITRDTSRNPLFDVMFILQNTGANFTKKEIQGLTLEPYEYEDSTSKFDLTLTIEEAGENFLCRWGYCTKLFKQETIRRFIKYFKKVVSEAVAGANKRISGIEIISVKEKQQILYDFNDTQIDYPREKTIHELFEEQVERTPDYTAAVAPRQMKNKTYMTYMTYISYRELNQKSDQLASLLKQKDVKPDIIVGLMVDRSVEMIIGIFGILKAGGAYLPLDPENPKERINYILKDSRIRLLLTQKHLEDLVSFQGETLELQDENLYKANAPSPGKSSGPGDSVYMIYTSGTTGKPKGTLVKHENLVNYVTWLSVKTQLGTKDKTPLTSSFAFDLGYTSLYPSLLAGSQLHILSKETYMLANHLLDYITTHGISYLKMTPSLFRTLVNNSNFSEETCSTLRLVVLGGEPINMDDIEKVYGICTHIRIINQYGPAEVTVASTALFINSDNFEVYKLKPTIGKPIFNTKVSILDQYLDLLPIGIAGELCLSGSGVSRGYLNQPELTFEKFCLRQPGALFEKTTPGPRKNLKLNHSPLIIHHSPIYKTGDLARWLADGNIEFLGRIDFQIKIRGYRIELEEIEKQLADYPDIKKAVVLARPDKTGDKYLCAYIVSHRAPTGSELREYLSQRLPDYMIPAYFVFLESIPLTANNKIHREALPAPQLNKNNKDTHTAPKNEIEKKLAAIWSEILGIPSENLSTGANFFHMGGHSLKASVLVSRVREEFDVELSLNRVFSEPFIKDMARSIKNAKKQIFEAIEPVEKKEYYPQSSAQKRLFILAQFEDIGTTYNMPAMLKVEGKLNKKGLEKAVKRLIQRHESLRTSFQMIDDEPVQRVLDPDEIKFTIEYFELKMALVEFKVEEKWPSVNNKRLEGTMGLAPLFLDPAARNSQPATALINSFIRPFDLSQAPLFRMGLIERHPPVAPGGHPRWDTYNSQEEKERQYILMVDMHHIAADGSSIGILIDEFTGLYSGESLASLNTQYKDFTCWQQKLSKTDKIKEQETYWQKNFPDTAEIPQLDLPLDYQRPVEYSFEGDSFAFTLRAGSTSRIKQLGTAAGVTLYMNLLTAFYLLLYKYTGQEDMIVGSVTAGRRHVQLQHIVGMFVNTLAIRNYPHGDKTYLQFLEEVKINSLEAFENQDIPFEALVDKLDLERIPSRNPLFDVCFALHNTDAGKLDKTVRNVVFKSYPWETNISKFDISIDAVEREDEIHFNLEYCTRLFKSDTVKRFANHFINILEILGSASFNWHIPLKNIDILSEEEKKQILIEFNNTFVDYPKEKGVHQLFAAQVERTPDHVALVGGCGAPSLLESFNGTTAPGDGVDFPILPVRLVRPVQLTYRELNEKSDQLAYCLKAKGVKPDTIVGLMGERSVEMIIGILGILKAGGAYLPLEPGYPQERIDFMMKDSSAKILVTLMGEGKKVGRWEGEKILLDEIMEASANNSVSREMVRRTFLGRGRRPLAYIIYTSGSTGKPKGVMVQHSSLVNRLFWLKEKFRLDERDVVMQKTVLTFDVSVCEIFRGLTSGGKLFLLAQRKEKDPDFIIETIGKYGITIVEFVPSMLNEFLARLDTPDKLKSINSLRWVFVGAEVLGPALVKNFKKILNAGKECNTRLINCYGPTEAAVDVTQFDCTANNDFETIPIGKPIANTGIFILNPQNPLQLMPIGAAGELCIYGVSLARGYLNNPELTAQKFLFGDYCFYKSYRSYVLYKTGDLARWLPDGNIQFQGRIDRQVKIRGFRIELGEIESQLMRHDHIKEAVILAEEDKNRNKYLCAYIVSRSNIPTAPGLLRNYLSRSLPDYMIPSYFIFLDEIPLTTNGKIDRRALPEPEQEAGREYAPPGNELEKTMVEIWAEVLGHDTRQISIHANFFEIGGDSLNALRVCSQLKKSTGVNIDISTFFSNQTINEICSHIHLRSQPHPKESRESIMKDLKNELTKDDKEKLLQELNKNTRLTSLLKQNKISREYPVSPLQKISLTISDHKILAGQILVTSYDFDSHPVTGLLEIKEIITKLMEENSLLRSIIINANKKYLIREFDSFSNIELPFLDISGYSPGSQEEILNLVHGHMKEPMDIIAGLLYRILVLKLRQGRCKILFAVNHLIFDGESSRILPEKIHHLRKHNGKKKKGHKTQKDFYDYVHFINRLNNRNIELEKYLDLNEYRQSIKSAARSFKTGELKIAGFELDISMMKKGLENFYHEIVLLSFAKSINNLFALDPVPITTVSHGRHYKDGNFSNVIGDFHDYIPVSFTFGHGAPPGRLLENFLNYKKYIRNKNLHFISLFANRKTNRSNLSKLLSPFSFNAMIGLYESVKNDADSQLTLLPANKNMGIGMRPEIFSIEMVKSPGADRLWINCSQNSQFEKERVKEEFIKNFTHLVNELDGI